MEDVENEPQPGLSSVNNLMKEEKMAFFEVNRTPPDERKRREKAAELAATQVPEVLMLTPFTSSPRIEFERIKLGRSGVRRLVVRNPGDKPMEVILDKLPKEEKGFSIDYVAFRLGGREETTLLIGWTPVKGGGIRDNFIVKFGKFSAQVILIGSCVAPEVKISKVRPTLNLTRPLGQKNTNIKSGPKSRPSVPASKLTAPLKIPIPPNPVVRKTDSPPKRLITGVSPPKVQQSPQNTKLDSFVCGAEFKMRELPRPESDSTPRRETFVHERPPPRGGDVVESTPIVSSRTETFRDIRRDTIVVEANTRLDFGYSVPSMPPPQLTDIRRQTFVPHRPVQPAQPAQGLSRRQTYVKLPEESPSVPAERRKWSVEQVDMARDPDVSGMLVGDSFVTVNTPEILKRVQKTSESSPIPQPPSFAISPKSDIPLNLSVAPLNLSARPKVLNDMLAEFLDNSDHEPLNLSVQAREESDQKPSVPVTKEFAQANLSLHISEPKTPTPSQKIKTMLVTPKPYCPQVSDISLPEPSPCVPTPKVLGTPLKDPRLMQLMNSFNISGNGSLDLSLGSQFGDCSMAVNLASPARDREKDLEDELENIENNKETWEDAELELIAKARGTSALSKSNTSPQLDRVDRLSTGTVVKTAPSLDPVVVPVIGISLYREEVEERECMVLLEEEVKTSEIIEEVIEYEYEIVGGERILVGERNLGRTVTCQSETMMRTPVKSSKSCVTQVMAEPECDVSRLIEEQLSGLGLSESRPRSVDLTAEQLDRLHSALPHPADDRYAVFPSAPAEHRDTLPSAQLICSNQVFNISHHQPVHLPPISLPPPLTKCLPTPTLPKSPEPVVRYLPGLRGSPRISNQMSSHPESFLQVTINETSFLPPSPDDPRRCSTGVKHKENMPVLSPSPNAEVRKSLFSPDQPKADLTETHCTQVLPPTDGFVPLSVLGYELPVIDSPSGESVCRLSSDTYIATVESPALSTIQETDENGTFERNGGGELSRPQSRAEGVVDVLTTTNTTFEKSGDQITQVENKTFEKDAEVVPEAVPEEVARTVIKERTPARPRRSNVSYTPQDIATIALSKDRVEHLTIEEENIESGLLFFPISPTQSEKRKPEMVPRSEQSKRTKTVVAASRPVVRAMKNPVPSRLAVKRIQNDLKSEKIKTVKPKDIVGRAVTKSLPPKPTLSRVTQPARRLHLVKPSKPGMVHHPNPFAARNQYYDERWIDKQERGFTRWLNFMLTPQVLEDTNDMLPGKVDVAKLWSQCSKDVKVPRAPTREVMSMRAYTARREMNRLRRAACKIWQSREVATVIGKVEFEIEKLRLVIRKDRNITKDVGMKQALLKIILSYNPLWLRIGLETVYGELLPVSTNSDLLGLSRFLVIRLLSNPDILAEFAHPTVPHSYREGHQEALNRFALKKFLELVYFLDSAKESRLIRHNPCLFCPDSVFKTSRDVLITFSKDYLSGEGDITKHMAYMGYVVNHKQTKLDEFDYAVTNVKADLRCGLRLVKVAELVTGVVASSNLRVPAVSRLQKVHNTDVALAVYKEGGLDLPKTITAKDIVDGHREKTLQLLWTIIFGYQLNTILDLQKLREEIVHLKRSLAVRVRMGDSSAQTGQAWLTGLKARSPQQGILAGESLMLVMEWAQLVMAHYQVEVENWTVSWCDGRGLCLLVHHYQPDLLARSGIKDETSLTHQAGHQNLDDSLEFNYGSKAVDPACYEGYIENEKANFKLLFSKVSELGGVPILITPGDMSNTIPDEKVTATFIGYLAARLLDLSREIKAARTIQLAWRRFSAVRKEEQFKVHSGAASIIQRQVRLFLARRRREKYEEAAMVLQKYTRGVLGRMEARRRRLDEQERRLGFAAVIVQTWWRGILARKERTNRMESLLVLQAGVRGMLARKRMKKQKAAALVLQKAWRSLIAERRERTEQLARRRAAVVIQAAVRGWTVKMRFKITMKKVVMVQAIVKGRLNRLKYVKLRNATCLIQGWWRAAKNSQEFRRTQADENKAAMKVQRFMRMVVARNKFTRCKEMVVRLQAACRGWFVRNKMNQRHEAVRMIQVWWRNVVRSQNLRRELEETKKKVLIIQSVVRRWVVRKRFLRMRKATVIIQRWVRVWKIKNEYKQKVVASSTIQKYWRNALIGRVDRRQFLREKAAALKIQAWWKMLREKNRFRKTFQKVVKIQSLVRQHHLRQNYLRIRRAVLVIQKQWRSQQVMMSMRAEFLLNRKAVMVIQASWRGCMVRTQIRKEKKAIIKLQSLWRMYTSRKKYLGIKKSSIIVQSWWRAVSAGFKVRRQREVERKAVIKLQAVYRGWRVRSEFIRTRQAAIVIQTWGRRSHARKKYLLLKKTVLCMQRQVRANQQRDLAMERFTRLRNGVVVLQAMWRGDMVRKVWREKRRGAVRIQSWLRMVLQRQKYTMLYQATLAMQVRVRRNKQAKQDRAEYLVKRKAACKVQSWWRMVQCKQSYTAVVNIVIMLQGHFRKYIKQSRFRQLKNAAIVTQRRVRMKMEGRRCRMEFLAMRYSAVVLQTMWRARQARIKFSQDMKKVVIVQSIVRGFLARRRVKCLQRHQLEHVQATKIQKHVRGWIELRKFKQLKNAAIVTQRRVRMKMEGRRCRMEFLAMRYSAVVLQTMWRARQARIKFSQDMKKVVIVQSIVRGFLARRRVNCLQRHQLETVQATKIQKHVRGWIELRKFKQLRGASRVIQIWWRRVQLGGMDRKRYLTLKKAALTIQSVWRGQLVRRQEEELMKSVTKCQAVVRGWLVRKQARDMNRVVMLLQSRFRIRLQGRGDRQIFLSKRKASILIQSWWRGVNQMKKFSNEISKVVTCQAMARGWLVRKQVRTLTSAVILIQNKVRSRKLVRKEREQFMKMRSSAVTIQSWWKGLRQKWMLKKEVASLVICQAVVRGWLCRKRFIHLRLTTILVQRNARAMIEGRRRRSQFVEMRRAAVRIQAVWRGHVQRTIYVRDMDRIVKVQATVRRKLVQARFAELRLAAVLVQSRWRAVLAGREARDVFVKQKCVAVQIQTWWRMVRDRRRFLRIKNVVVACQEAVRGKIERRKYLRKQSAALLVQSWFRGCRDTRKERELFLRRRAAMVTLQAIVRGWLQQKRFTKFREATCLIQRNVRGWLVRKQVVAWRMEMRRETAARLLQRQLKGYLVRKRMKLILEKRRRDRAAVLIQSCVRGWVVRKTYQKQLLGTLTLQRQWRSIQLTRKIRNQYLLKRRSALTLQTWWRRVKEMRTFQTQKSAIRTLQGWVRTKLAEMRFARLRLAAIIVQRRWRATMTARMQQKRYLMMRSAAVTLQSRWRGKQARCLYHTKVQAVITLQKSLRAWLARRFVSRKKAALLCLQRAVKRMALAKSLRKEFLAVKQLVVGLQARGRGHLARRQFLRLQDDQEYRVQVRMEVVANEEKRRQQAAKTITQVVRVVVERKRFIRARTAATTIQKSWRGHWHRKVVMEQWSSSSSRLSILKDINVRLREVNAVAKAEDSLGARTASAIDYIFSIKDVAQLICAVKTLDFSTRLSLDCSMKMMEGLGGVTPVAQLVSLMTRCNRSVPHMEVVSTILDILLNVARVVLTREAVAIVPNLLPDVFQTMLVYRDTGAEIFSKCCALLQVMSVSPLVGGLLAQSENAKKLTGYEMIVTKKRKLKDENQRRRSFNVSALPVPARKPLRPTNSINQLNRTSTMGLNTTMTTASATTVQSKARKVSTSVATGPPWCHQTQPRFHEDPVVAISALNRALGLSQTKK